MISHVLEAALVDDLRQFTRRERSDFQELCDRVGHSRQILFHVFETHEEHVVVLIVSLPPAT